MREAYASVIGPVLTPVMASIQSVSAGLGNAMDYSKTLVTTLSSLWSIANQFSATLVDRLRATFTAIMILFGRIRSSIKRLLGIFTVVIHLMTTMMATASTGIRGPVGQTIGFFCYHPLSTLRLASSDVVKVGDIRVGDELAGGHRILGVITSDTGATEPFYEYDGAFVTGTHPLATGEHACEGP